MLNLRSALVLTAAGLCLWGLFSLLSHLKEPGLLRSEKATVVKGCDDVSNEDMRKTCAPLFCQKALIDAKLVPWNTRFTIQQRPSAARPDIELVTGSTDAQQHFACVVKQAQVLARGVFDDEALTTFTRQADENPDSLVQETTE